MDKETLVVCLTQMREYWRKRSWWAEPNAGCSWCILPQCSFLSHVQLFETPWTAAYQASPSFTVSWNLLKLMSIELVMPSNHLILCHLLLLLPSIFHHQGLFQWVGSLPQVASIQTLEDVPRGIILSWGLPDRRRKRPTRQRGNSESRGVPWLLFSCSVGPTLLQPHGL